MISRAAGSTGDRRVESWLDVFCPGCGTSRAIDSHRHTLGKSRVDHEWSVLNAHLEFNQCYLVHRHGLHCEWYVGKCLCFSDIQHDVQHHLHRFEWFCKRKRNGERDDHDPAGVASHPKHQHFRFRAAGRPVLAVIVRLHAQRRKRQRELFNIQRAELAHCVFDLRLCFDFANDRNIHGECKRE